MRYDWDIDKLKELRKTLNKLKSSEISKVISALVRIVFASINKALFCLRWFNPITTNRIAQINNIIDIIIIIFIRDILKKNRVSYKPTRLN